MKAKSLVRYSSILSLPLCGAGLTHAQLVDDFDTTTPAVTSTQGGSAPGPTITAGGPTGDFLRLTDTVNGQTNRYIYDNTDVGGYETINAQWDYRASTGSTADGFGFAFLPTATFGTTGDADPGIAAEEPNIGGAFSVGIDLHPAADVNDVSFHYDGLEYTNARLNTGIVDLNDGNFHRFNLTMQQVGNGTNATLTVTSDVHGAPGTTYTVMSQAMPFLPYENRVGLYGRTGGLNVAQDIDNLNVTSSTAFGGGLPVAPTGGLYQDFDSSGATSYVSRIHSITDTANTRPGPLLMAGDAGSDGAFMRLLNDGVNTNRNSITFDRAVDGGITNHRQTVSMDMRMDSAGNPADGVGILLLPTADYGERGAGPDGGSFEEAAAAANALKVGFDLYNAENDIVIHAGATEITRVDVDPGVVDLNSGVFNRYHVSVEPTAGGVNVVVDVEADINGAAGARTQIASAFVPGAQVFDYRVQVGGRTGGAFHNADIDNIQTSHEAVVQTATTTQTFENNGGVGETGFKAYKLGAGLVPALVDDGGNTVLRLAHDGQNGQTNTLAFDQSLDGIVTTQNAITADFSFRASSVGDAADGFSLRLLDTDTYGTTGMGTNGAGAEEPNIAGVLAFGFDLHPAATANDVSIHFGDEKTNLTLDPNTQIDLDDGQFHDVSIYIENNGSGVDVDMTIDGQDIFTDFFVDGYNVESFRAEFAARSGGLNFGLDLDNIAIAAIPEPSAVLLVTLTGFAALRRRRR